jgi:hypothetical protein
VHSDFSEFSYGYAAIHEAELELSAIYKQAGAPKLPSLVEEKDLGWDVRLAFVDFVVFLQFKRSEWISRRHPDSPTWGGVNAKHYRYGIDTSGHQHRALLRLEDELNAQPGNGNVYYVAPVFHTQSAFDRAYGRGEVLQGSSLVPPSDIGDSSGRHHVVAHPGGSIMIMSEPRFADRATTWERVSGNAANNAVAVAQRIPRSRFTVGDLEATLERSVERLERDLNVDPDAPVISRLHRSAALLGCGLALALLPVNT